MSYSNKFLSTGDVNVSDGSTRIYGSTVGGKDLSGSSVNTLKIDSKGYLYPSQITGSELTGVVRNPVDGTVDVNENAIIDVQALSLLSSDTQETTTLVNTGASGPSNLNLHDMGVQLQNIGLTTSSGQTDFNGDVTVGTDLQVGGAIIGDFTVNDFDFTAGQTDPVQVQVVSGGASGISEVTNGVILANEGFSNDNRDIYWNYVTSGNGSVAFNSNYKAMDLLITSGGVGSVEMTSKRPYYLSSMGGELCFTIDPGYYEPEITGGPEVIRIGSLFNGSGFTLDITNLANQNEELNITRQPGNTLGIPQSSWNQQTSLLGYPENGLIIYFKFTSYSLELGQYWEGKKRPLHIYYEISQPPRLMTTIQPYLYMATASGMSDNWAMVMKSMYLTSNYTIPSLPLATTTLQFANGGTTNAIGNYGSVTDFSIVFTQPFRPSDIHVVIVDSIINQWTEYGGRATLTNGVRFFIKGNHAGAVKEYFSDVIKSNYEYALLCRDVRIEKVGADMLTATAHTSGTANALIYPGWEIGIEVHDDFTGLIVHRFSIHGSFF